MKIKKFRIKNYKSIIDSGDCYVEQDLTIFAGKNESGKTSVLEALENINAEKNIPDNAKPIGKKVALSEITLTLIFTPTDLNKFFEKAKIEKKASKDQVIEITKTFPNLYTVDAETEILFEIEKNNCDVAKEELENKIKIVYKEISSVHNQFFSPVGWGLFTLNLQDTAIAIKQLNAYFQNYRNSYVTHLPNQSIRTTHQSKIQELQKLIGEYQAICNSRNDNWALLFEMLPNFILFRSFEDIIPNEVPFTELEKSDIVKDLTIISNIDIPLIKSDDKRSKLQHHKEINIRFNKEYSKFWLQDLTEMKIHWDNNILQFWIEDDNVLFKPSERSKGKQWHMSFYIKITARAIEEKTNVILIDEPRLYLHATAQNDIYKKLIDRSKKSQILYTTHSPYLINKNELHRVRLVLKGNSIREGGTVIENKIHAKADKETLTPILTAIGLGLCDGIQNIQHEKNIIIEGPSDYFYLQGFKLLLKNTSYNFIFGGGSGNMGNVGTILAGWGCKVIYLYDNDQGLKDGSKNLKKVWFIKKELIHSVKENAGTIEDIFSKGDFQKVVLQDKVKFETSNSDYIKKNNSDKVLLARQFNSLCNSSEIKLTEETVGNVKNLFDRLNLAFNNLNDQPTDVKNPTAINDLTNSGFA